ncbi:MAG: hypothetical protein KDD42_00770 [Bdellovibrionales bacterium]|nr:hypothetical protein [Bdellovibrionales bacterium]
MNIKTYFALITVLLLTCGTAQAELLCVKRSAIVKKGKVNLSKAIIVNSSSCPNGYSSILNTATIVTDGSISTAKLADGSVTEDKLASGIQLKSISINPFGTVLTGTASYGVGFGKIAGVNLPDAANSSMTFGFTLPADYTTGNEISIHMVANTDATSCGVSLQPNSVSISRTGIAHINNLDASGGLTSVGGDTRTFGSTANIPIDFDFVFNSPVEDTPLQAGDAINLSVFRAGTVGSDTCTDDLTIQGIVVHY